MFSLQEEKESVAQEAVRERPRSALVPPSNLVDVLTQPLAQSAAELAAQPVAQAMAQAVAQTLVKPKAELAAQLVAQPMPAAEFAAQPLAQTTANLPAQASEQQAPSGEVRFLKQELQEARQQSDELNEKLVAAEEGRRALQEEADRLREENEGLKRQRARLLEETAAAAEQHARANAGVARGGVFPPGEELAQEQGSRREAMERIAKLEVLLHESRAKLSEREDACKWEEKLRREGAQTIENLEKKIVSMQRVIEAVDVSITEVTDADGSIDPVRLVLNLARMALPYIEHRGDPHLAIAQLEVATKDAERPPLVPGTAALAAPLPPEPLPAPPAMCKTYSAPVLPQAAFAPVPAQGLPQAPVQVGHPLHTQLGLHSPQAQAHAAHAAAKWSTPLGLRAPGAGPTLGWPPTPPPPKPMFFKASEADSRALYRGSLPLQSVVS